MKGSSKPSQDLFLEIINSVKDDEIAVDSANVGLHHALELKHLVIFMVD